MKTRYKNVIASALINNIKHPVKDFIGWNLRLSNVRIGYNLNNNNIDVIYCWNLKNSNQIRTLTYFAIKDLFYQRIKQELEKIHINCNVSISKYLSISVNKF